MAYDVRVLYELYLPSWPLSDADGANDTLFLAELQQRYTLDDVVFLDDADYLRSVLAEDGYRFQTVRHGNRNAIERVFYKIEKRNSSLETYSVMSSSKQIKSGSKASPLTTIHAQLNPMDSK